VVESFEAPVATDPPGDLGGCRLVDGEAGDGVDGDGLPLLRAGWPGAAGDADGLGGVREEQPLGEGDDLDGAALVSSVTRSFSTSIMGIFRQGRPLTWEYRLGWFFFTTRM
jgi:hypothetical protein